MYFRGALTWIRAFFEKIRLQQLQGSQEFLQKDGRIQGCDKCQDDCQETSRRKRRGKEELR